MEDQELQKLCYHLSLIILSSVSFTLNLLIVAIFIGFRKDFFPKNFIPSLRAARNHNKCLLSLAFADLLVGFFGEITGILLKFVQNRLIYKLCGLIPLYGSMFASVFSLILITIDRLVAVKYPFSYQSFMANSGITTSIALCWIIPLLTIVSQIILYVTVGLRLELKIRNTILTVVSVTGFIVLTISNFILIQKVKQQRQMSNKLLGVSQQLIKTNKTKPSSHEAESGKVKGMGLRAVLTDPMYEENHPPLTPDAAYRAKPCFSITFESSRDTDKQGMRSQLIKKIPDSKITTTCICITVTFLICWLPLVGYRFSYVVGRTTQVPWFRRLTQCLALTNSLFNPFIYFMVRKEFRELFKKLLVKE